jgi:predicted nucleic acid-binding protein
MLKIVLDTNIILSSVSSKSPYRLILDALFARKYELYVSNDILLEYEEKLAQNFDAEVAELTLSALLLLPNVYKIG